MIEFCNIMYHVTCQWKRDIFSRRIFIRFSLVNIVNDIIPSHSWKTLIFPPLIIQNHFIINTWFFGVVISSYIPHYPLKIICNNVSFIIIINFGRNVLGLKCFLVLYFSVISSSYYLFLWNLIFEEPFLFKWSLF